MIVVMAMMMIMVVVMVVPVRMAVTVTVGVIIVVMVDTLRRPAALHLLAEHQRLDGDRHGVGRHADTAEVDVVEIAQHHAVDAKDLALDQELLAQDRAERLRDVAVEHDVDRLLVLDGVLEAVADAFRERGDALVGR